MSDGETEVAPKKRRGRPPGAKATARRHDPEDAPIDGDFQKDITINGREGERYALVSAEDMPKMLGRGYVATPRTKDGPRPVYDIGNETESGYRVDNLTHMTISQERYDRIQRHATSTAERRMKGARSDAMRIDPTAQVSYQVQH